MSEALCLAIYGLVVAVLAPRVIFRVTRGANAAPRSGVVLWLCALASATGSWVGAVVLFSRAVIGSDVVRHVAQRCISAVCAAALGAHGTPARWGVLVVFASASAGVAVIGVRGGAALWRSRRRTLAHACAARLVGRLDRRLGIVVVDVPDKIVYSVAGRPSAIVVSEPALAALTDLELRAVLAHEHAHLSGRHHLILGFAQALAKAMPPLPLFTAGPTALGRLVEMWADDNAARRHDARTLVTALLALAGPPTPPQRALAAAASGVTERAGRLLGRASVIQVRSAWAASALLISVLLATPVLAATSATSGIAWCAGLLLSV